jgi:uncharacterized protein YvpB
VIRHRVLRRTHPIIPFLAIKQNIRDGLSGNGPYDNEVEVNYDSDYTIWQQILLRNIKYYTNKTSFETFD